MLVLSVARREAVEVCNRHEVNFFQIDSQYLDWEGFGADPVLQAFGGALSVKGIQSVGVIATIKHLVANEQEMYVELFLESTR